MRYISDDGRVFNTEKECYEYEKHIQDEEDKRIKLEEQRRSELDEINRKYDELHDLISNYKQKYGDIKINYVSPFSEFARLLLGCME